MTTAPLIIEKKRGWGWPNFGELYAYRHLFYFLAIRDIKAAYRQTVLGFLWAFIGPVMTMVVLSFVFGSIAKVPSENMPYPIFAFAALVPWTYFTSALSGGANSLLQNSGILTKVYFPRILLPVVSLVSGLTNFCISMLILVGMMVYFGVTPTVNVLWLPLFILLAMAFALGVALILAPLNAQFRDVGQAIPYLISVGFYITPVAYPLRVVPEPYATLLQLNPITHVVNGFRWALLGTDTPPNLMVLPAAALTLVALIIGIVWFHRAEHTFSDVI